MQTNYSEHQLKNTLLSQKIENKNYYYSLAKKEQKSLSFLKNDRLLVLNFDDGIVFYVNQHKNLPFRNNPPRPKKEYALVETSLFRKVPLENVLEVVSHYQNDSLNWKFEMETKEMVEQWLRILEYQKKSKALNEKDMKAINKGIMQLGIEKQLHNDIVKQPERNILQNQYKMLDKFLNNSGSRLPQKEEVIQTQPESHNKQLMKKDWNYRFLKYRNEQTLYEFKIAAEDAFYSAYQKDKPTDSNKVRYYENEDIAVLIANRYTQQARLMKNQYRNYHFILEATKRKFIVGVPLAIFIQFEAVVALVKARFPVQVQKINFDVLLRQELKDLERYTRVRNKVIQSGIILNLSKFYQPKRAHEPLIYLDNLVQYLPSNSDALGEICLLRPEHILDNVKQLVHSGNQEALTRNDIRLLKDIGEQVSKNCKPFSQMLTKIDFKICNSIELKNLIHQSGINLKYLPLVYSQCENVNIKKYIYSMMAAKVSKDYIFENILKIKLEDPNTSCERIIENILITLIEGSNNKSHGLWKEISLSFKKKYNIVLNHKQIIPSFFLNSMLCYLPAKYDLSKLDQSKTIFEQQRIISVGFVSRNLAKVKCYTRFITENLENIKFQAKEPGKSQQICKKITTNLHLTNGRYPIFYHFADNHQWMLEYMSYYIPPQIFRQSENSFPPLYDSINQEPPTAFTLQLTKNYLQWCNRKQDTQQFKRIFETAMIIADYWLIDCHPMRSDLLECLSEYYSILGINDQMVKYMKQSLNLCLKFGGSNCSQAGLKYYELADRYLRANRKRQSADLFHKAIDNIQLNKIQTNRHALSLMKISSIYLSDLQYQKAVDYAYRSIKSFQGFEKRINSNGLYNEPFKIKAFQILARVFQICDRKAEYKEMALQCARKFNATKNHEVYEQMVRICVAASIFKANNDRSQSFSKLVESVISSQGKDRRQGLNPIQQLMRISDDYAVMERFIIKFEHFERSLFQLNLKRKQMSEQNKQFMSILGLVIDVVGEDYISGLIEQKMCLAIH